MSDNIRHEKSKEKLAKELGYQDWETCINDQPNYKVEELMDRVVDQEKKEYLKDVLEEVVSFIDSKSILMQTVSGKKSNELHLNEYKFKEFKSDLLNHIKQRKG